jgi:hypothetical protein
MIERTQLGEKILNHWRENRPQMVKDLERENRLQEAVIEAQELTGDLLYELVSVQRLDYQAAWELALSEWALPSDKIRRKPY